MLPWTLIGTAHIPGERAEMHLHRRGNEYSIRVGTYELMNSRVHGSEEALAELVCARVGENARVLIGGLGMGFTLAAMLRCAGAGSEIVVAELVPEVVAWHRGPLRAVSGGALEDARVRVVEADVARVIRGRRDAFDAVVLDVDNGPRGLTARRNDWLYGAEGLRAIAGALRAGGVLAVWSAGPDAAFARRVQQAGFAVEERRVRGSGGKGARYVIWIATASGAHRA